MNRSAKKTKGLLLGCLVLLLLLAACAPYRQAVYYPATASYPVYGGSTVITQRSYYGAYPYNYIPAPPVYRNYYHDHDDHDHQHGSPVIYYSTPPRYKEGRLKPEPPDRHPHHPKQNFPQWGKKEPINSYPDRAPNHERKEPSHPWDRQGSDSRHQPDDHQYGRPRPAPEKYGQNRWPHQDRRDRKNANDGHPRFDNQRGNGVETVHHETPKNQRDYRRKEPQQRLVNNVDT